MRIKPLGALFGVAFGLAALAAPLAAQESLQLVEDQWYLSPMGSLVLDDPSELDQNGGGLHLGVGRGVSPNWLIRPSCTVAVRPPSISASDGSEVA